MPDSKIHIRLFVAAALPSEGVVALDREQSHYLANVMRKKVGDPVALFNGRDGEWACEIAEVQKRLVLVRVTEKIKDQVTEPQLTLAFAPIKKARIDFMAQKATELGVAHLQPIYTRRTIVDRVKTDRLHANAVEAAEQCERLTVPTIAEPIKLEAYLASLPDDQMIMFCDEDKSGKSAHQALAELPADQKLRPWAIIIGPEGGFDDSERDLIRKNPNTIVVALGPRILRADTAAMAAISLWQSAIGDWG
jgi:16S rRNA (uracil1498-N3)-methyltransferase